MKNEFELIGRITQKPKLLNTKIDNIPYTFVNIAISKRIKQDDGEYKEYTEFIKVSYFRKTAEFISNYVNIGDLVLIKGHIKIRKDFDVERMINLYSNELIGDTLNILARSNKNKEEQKELNKEIEQKHLMPYTPELEKYLSKKQKEEVKEELEEKIKTDEIVLNDSDLPF